MICRLFLIFAILVTANILSVSPSRAKPLSMAEAVAIALRVRDPSVGRFDAKAAALDNRSVADSQLPDPVLRAGQFNVPVDSFDFNREGSTQFRFDLLQKFPAGDTLRLRGQKRRAEARGEDAKSLLQESRLRLATRLTWLELYYLRGANRKVSESRNAVRELVQVATAIFGTGRDSSQDVLRAEVELSVLDDRLIKIDQQRERLKADMVRLIGRGAASKPIASQLPRLATPPPLPQLRAGLPRHPSVQIDNAQLDARRTEIDLAGAKYRPEWTAELRYGIRNNDRSDLLTARIGMTLPIFPEQRQDRNYAAAQHNHLSAQFSRDARLRDLQKNLERYFADWKRSGERVSLYRRVVIQRAKATTEASLSAYRAGRSDFAELIRSRLAQLNAELSLLRLRVDRAKAHSNILFVAGK